MASANTSLYDRAVDHAANLRIHEEALQRELRGIHSEHERMLRKIFTRDLTTEQYSRAVTRELHRNNRSIFKFAKKNLNEVGITELDFHANTLDDVLGGVYKVKKPRTLPFLGKLTGTKIRGNKNFNQQVETILGHEKNRIMGYLKKNPGVVASERVAGIIQQGKTSRAQLDTLLTTSMTQTQMDAFDSVLGENEGVITGYRFTAVLDSKTSEICAHHDGQIYAPDDKRFHPPLHWNCRSVMVPVVKPFSEMKASEDPRFNQKKLDSLSPERVGFFDGIIPDVEDYDTWLRRQPLETQLRHLDFDEDKLNLFQGGQKLRSFTDARGGYLDIDEVKRLDAAALKVRAPVAQRAYDNDPTFNFKIEAYTPDQLITSPAAAKQLRDLYTIDANNKVADLSVVDYRFVPKQGQKAASSRDIIRGKRNARFQAQSFDPDNFYFDMTTGERFNPIIYRPDANVLEERLKLVRGSKILNSEQKKFVEDFQLSLRDQISDNQRAAVVDNLRRTLEQRLDPTRRSYGEPWENLTAVIRRNMQDDVVNVSERLRLSARKTSVGPNKSKFVTKAGKPAITFAQMKRNKAGKLEESTEILDFDEIAGRVADNQRFFDEWTEKKGLDIALKAYVSGKAPLRTYFLPPSQKNPLDFRKKMIKALDDAVDKANIVGRAKTSMKETIAKWTRNPLDVAEDALLEMARELNVKWHKFVSLEFLYRRTSTNLRKNIVNNLPETQQKAIKALSSAMKDVAGGASSDYDAVAIAIGKTIRKEFQIDLPWRKPKLADYHKDGSRFLKHLEDQGLIRINVGIKDRRSTFDLDTGRADVGGWKETISREIEIIDGDLQELQKAARINYVGRRIGITESKNQLHLKKNDLRYYDAKGNRTTERAITRSASSKFSGDDDVLADHLDRDFVNQGNYANSLKWTLDEEFTDFMVQVAKNEGRVSRQVPNAYAEMIANRGEQGQALIASLQWHKQNKSTWSNIWQWDGRGRFYEQGYLASTRGETVRPYLEIPEAKSLSLRGIEELKRQAGATLGSGQEALSNAGRIAAFEARRKDLVELGKIVDGTLYGGQRQRRINAFLEHKLINGHDAEEIPKIARIALETRRQHAHIQKHGFPLGISTNYEALNATNKKKFLAAIKKYKYKWATENDASASGFQIIGITTRDRQLAKITNLVPTDAKQRLYDVVAQRTHTDPRYQRLRRLYEFIDKDDGWEDLVKASKQQNMVLGYGAGDATQVAGVEAKIAERLLKATDNIIIYRGEKRKGAPGWAKKNPERVYRYEDIKASLKAEQEGAIIAGMDNTAAQLKQIETAFDDLIFNEIPISSKIQSLAREIDADVSHVIDKLTNQRQGLVGPREFKEVADIMGGYVDQLAPNARVFTNYYKNVAKTYFPVAGVNDYKWVNFRGKTITQRFRPQVEEGISFKDPITGRNVTNIYRGTIDDDWLKGKASIIDATTGMGVNGNHSNDASLVQAFWLKAREEKQRIGTVHDGFFAHAEDAQWTQSTLQRLMSGFVKKNPIKDGLEASRKHALSQLGREQRRFVGKRLDKLADKAVAGKLTKKDLQGAMEITPGLEDFVVKSTGAGTRQNLAKLLGKYQNKAYLDDIGESIQDGSYSITKFNNAIKFMPAFEKALVKKFKLPKAGLLDRFSKHGNLRRLNRQLERLDNDDLTPGQFWFFAEKFDMVNDVSRIRREYGIRSLRGLEKAIDDGSFSIREFLNAGVRANQGGLDPEGVLDVIRALEAKNYGGVDPRDVATGIIAYRKDLRKQFRHRKKLINEWYDERIRDARDLNLIDKNQTNAARLKQIDAINHSLDQGIVNYGEIYDTLFNAFKSETARNKFLKDTYGLDRAESLKDAFQVFSAKDLREKYPTRNSIRDLVSEFEDRWRELTPEDLLREPAPGEALYGIGP